MEVFTGADANQVKEVRLVTRDGNKIVKFTEALRMAELENLDLVCVSNESNPPVCRIQDYKKILFESKKARSKKPKKVSVLKEIQFKVNISEHDIQTKLKNVRKFLERGDKVKISIRLKGRERENPLRGEELLKRILEEVDAKSSRIPGPQIITLLEPSK